MKRSLVVFIVLFSFCVNASYGILTASERIANISEIRRSERIVGGAANLVSGLASLIIAYNLYNYTTTHNTGLSLGGMGIFLFGIPGIFLTQSGINSLWYEDASVESELKLLKSLEEPKREQEAVKYLRSIAIDSVEKNKHRLFVLNPSNTLEMNEYKEYLSEHKIDDESSTR